MKRIFGNGRSRFAVLMLVGVVASVAAASASAQTTAVSTVAKSGRDAASGSTASSSSGAVGATAAGHTIDWTVQYRNATGAAAGADLRDVIGSNQTYVPGSLKVPSGFAARWSTDGGATFAAAEPASGVDAIGAAGTSVDGSTGDQVVVRPASSAGFNVGAVGGDGWEALFLDDNVYNVHHHRMPAGALTMIDCHVKSTGAACPGFAGGGTYASENAGDPLGTGADTLVTAFAPSGVAEAATGRIYFPAAPIGSTSIGVGCADVRASPPASCGYTHLASVGFANPTGNSSAQINGGGVIGSNYYLLDGTGRIHCFDISAGSACAGLAAPTGIGATDRDTVNLSSLEVFDDRYVFANLNEGGGHLLCLDTTTGGACPGFPIIGYAGALRQMSLAPTLSPTGAVTGICGAVRVLPAGTTWKCYDLAGAPKPTPWPPQVPQASVNFGGWGSALRIATKLYFAETNSSNEATYTCWDFAIGAPCDGFVQASSGVPVYAYTLRQDPTAPDCIWQIGDAGQFETFSATFGGLSCQPTESAIAVDPASYYCDGAPGHVTGWRALAIGGVSAADHDGLAVTLTGIDGSVVPGWNGRVFPDTQQTIDISSIPITGNTARLRFSVVFNDLRAPATVTATFNGDPVQACFKTRVGGARCSGTPPIANDATVVTSVAIGATDAPAGNRSGAATFRVADDPAACPVDPARGSLRLRKTADKRSVRAGRRVRYAIRVTNPSAIDVHAVRVCDLLPQGLAYVSSTPHAVRSNGRYCWSLGTLAAQASRTVRITARTLLGTRGRRRNTARVTGRAVRPRTARWTIRVRAGATRAGGVTG